MTKTYEIVIRFDVEVSDLALSVHEAGIRDELRYLIIQRVSEWVKRWRCGLLAFDDVEIDYHPKEMGGEPTSSS